MSWKALEGTHLGESQCIDCGTLVMCVQDQTDNARCMDCGRKNAGVNWPAGGPIGKWHPGLGYPKLGWGAPRLPEAPADRPPQPEVTSRQGQPSGAGMPASVESLVTYGRASGWQFKIQYSLGYATKYLGRWQQEEQWGVRFEREGYGCFAVHRSIAGRESWTWNSVWVWGADLLPFGQCGVTELKAWLEDPGMPPEWYEKIVTRRLEQKERAKARPASKKAKEGMS